MSNPTRQLTRVCGIGLAIAFLSSVAPVRPSPPVSTADPNASDVEQMEQVIRNLGDHLRPDNLDMRFSADSGEMEVL